MRVFKIWHKAQEKYMVNRPNGKAQQSCFDTRATAGRIMGRFYESHLMEIHTYRLERAE